MTHLFAIAKLIWPFALVFTLGYGGILLAVCAGDALLRRFRAWLEWMGGV